MKIINFFKENTKYNLQNKKKLRELIEIVCKKEGKMIVCLNLILCDDDYLKEINKKHLKKTYYTDVISFDFKDKENNVEGDIYVSVDRTKENAEKFKTKHQIEILRVITHGVLHLIGYNDKTKKEKEIMTQKENKYISLYKNS